MSLYPIIWAAEHAPIYDAEERAILVALVIKGDFDGCNCFRSRPKLAQAARVDPKTVDRKLAAMAKRGLLRRQPGPKPTAWLKLPRDKRPVVWEVLIPCEFWSAVQLEEINEARAERGRGPITPETRPPIADAPPKKARTDKGKARPKTKRGDSKSSRSEASGGTHSPVAPGLTVQSRGDFKSTNLLSSPSDSPSSSYVPHQREPVDTEPKTEEEDRGQGNDKAQAVVDEAIERWDPQHRRPTRTERGHIAKAVATALADGATPDDIVRELTRDLSPRQVASSAVQVIRYRIKEPGWAKPTAPTSKPTVLRPTWCGTCDERTRLVDDGDSSRRCPDCHPLAVAS